ncbi:LptA/OstA family protein [Pseudodesulfovibrio sp. zrk46]|uniref:LptA/OstA family protein n=1 Tax=Pseudodesulfovibrio sp. zrk46 TaxID=2725288 RepID=UPI00144936F2|nr:LptA/OstA family protein [Pseudodesulfovibrio sp. zrk46]QJB57652.1 LPS ABC transporter substrate-binding protein LptA [Pseudodesulfovibrio sp. zrk46]
MKILYTTALTLLCLLLASGSACAEDWGEIREATQNLNVRDQRTPKGEHVVTLARGQRVKVDFLRNGWFAVFNLNEASRDEKRAIGYANSKFLAKVAQQPSKKTADETTAVESKQANGEGEVKAGVAATPPSDTGSLGVDPTRTPVQISSDRMVYNESGRVVSFVGNVVAEHGGLTLWANKLSAYLGSKSGKQFSADSIERIVASGNVRAKKGKSEGTCGKLTYFVASQMLKMEDNPKLQDGPNSLTGEVINFYARENRSEVVGGKGQRVRAVFMTPEGVKVP